MKKLTLLLLALLYVTLTYAYTERDLLQKQADINRLKEILVLDRQWVTYPDYNDRAGWDRFLGTFKDEYIRRGEKRLNYQWQVVKLPITWLSNAQATGKSWKNLLVPTTVPLPTF